MRFTKNELTMISLVKPYDRSDAINRLWTQEELTPDKEIKEKIPVLIDKLKEISDQDFLRLPIMDYFGD